MLARASLCLALLWMPGCALSLKQMNPQPNVALVPQQKALTFAVADTIPDVFVVDAGNTIVKVQGWRTSLTNGFHNAFAASFSPDGKGEGMTLALDEVRLELGAFGGGAPARVQYKATLYEPGGKVHRTAGVASRASGTSLPARQMFSGNMLFVGDGFLEPSVEATLEEMYEQVAKRLLGKEAMSRR